MEPANLFGWSDQTWLYLDHYGILLADVFTTLTVAAVVVGFIKRRNIRRWLSRNRFPRVGENMAGWDWGGMVFTVSREDLPKWVLETCRPERVGLVASDDSLKAAQSIADRAGKLNIAVQGTVTVDPDDPAAVRTAVMHLLDNMAAHTDRPLAVDVTGGKVPMSLGGFMAAEEQGADTVYVSCRWDSHLRAPDIRTARIVGVSRPEEA